MSRSKKIKWKKFLTAYWPSNGS